MIMNIIIIIIIIILILIIVVELHKDYKGRIPPICFWASA